MIEITDILEVEKHIDDVDAVIFDLDDTLYSEKEYVRSGYRAIADYFRMPKLVEEMWRVFEKHGTPIDEVLEKYGMMNKKTEALRIYRFHKPEIHLYPGVAEMLVRISNRKKIGIITDGRPEGQRAKIKALGLDSLFDVVIVTDELGGIECRKPSAIGFLRLHEKTGIPFEQIVYIGDNMMKDFTAPKKLGMQCICFHNSDGLYKV